MARQTYPVNPPVRLICRDLPKVRIEPGSDDVVTLDEDDGRSRHVESRLRPVLDDTGTLTVQGPAGAPWDVVTLTVPGGTAVIIERCRDVDVSDIGGSVEARLEGHEVLTVRGAAAVDAVLGGQSYGRISDCAQIRCQTHVQAQLTVHGRTETAEISSSGQSRTWLDGAVGELSADASLQSAVTVMAEVGHLPWKVAVGQSSIEVNGERVADGSDHYRGISEDLADACRRSVRTMEDALRRGGPEEEAAGALGYELVAFNVPYDAGGGTRIRPTTLLVRRVTDHRGDERLVVLGRPPLRHPDGNGRLRTDMLPRDEPEEMLGLIRNVSTMERRRAAVRPRGEWGLS